jgi:hypothetical protein
MIKEVFLDLYNRTFMIFVAEDQDAVNTKLSTYFGCPTTFDISRCLGSADKVISNGKMLIVIYIATANLDIDNFGTITHEAVHAANDVFEFIGVDLDIANDEPQAYLVDWIARQIFGALNEYHAKRC